MPGVFGVPHSGLFRRSRLKALILMKLNGVQIDRGFKSRGIPSVDVTLGGSIVIGKNFDINNGS